MNYFSKKFQYTFTAISIFTIIITSVMDLNDTHMTNPLWVPHARFHWACQYFATILMSVLALYCLFGKYKDKGSVFSVVFIGLSPLFFWGMFIPALLMPGTSTAPDGIVLPTNFPKIFTIIHPNFIIACVISVVSVVITFKELKFIKINVK
ncbi:hypothetical protein CAPN006_12880 [Capnocytophaga canimorsus]|uniref:hypothetical protein n=1 Tax=Capnocytophaga canimorsus TaxID=28188 RepID=UPI001AC980EE|nr:hypothetical protein [Capnocytophaga canimorsus]GIM56895.1 hypothetical protein CAPN006_12880 [Capnocytophaga canimorsus]